MKKIIALLTALTLALLLAACGGTAETQASAVKTNAVTVDAADLNTDWQSESYTDIDLDEAAASSGGAVVIDKAGVYRLHGSLEGCVKVTATGSVWLVLDGAVIRSTDCAPIYISAATRTVITLADGSANTLSDSGTYAQNTDGDPSAALFCKNDLTINGGGSLSITTAYNGIGCKDVLKIVGGSFDISAANDGIKGRDALVITAGSFGIVAGRDALKSNNDNGTGWGFIDISGGTFTLSAADDGIQAVTKVTVSGGTLSITSGGGTANAEAHAGSGFDPHADFGGGSTGSDDDSEKAKGICCDGSIEISGGNIDINSADDALHSNGLLAVSGGTVVIAAGDDGIHADTSITISGGDIKITDSYEGVESDKIYVSGGIVSVTAADDGFNASDGSSSSGGMFNESGDSDLHFDGGAVYVNAGGDGLDANGSIFVTGGEVYVDGPTDSGNGALDSYNGIFVSGGTLIACGSTGMAETLDPSSGQPGVLVNYSGSASSTVTIKNESGETLASFTPAKGFGCAVISCPGLALNGSYSVYVGSELAAAYSQDSASVTVGNGGGMVPGNTDPGGGQGGGSPGGRPGEPGDGTSSATSRG